MIFVETDKFINFLVKHNMTANQFMFCYLKANYDIAHFKKYATNRKNYVAEAKAEGRTVPGGVISSDELKDLVHRGYLEDFNDKGRDYIDSYLVTPKFTKEMFIETEQAGEELWATYPPFITINTSRVSARSCDKDTLIKTYCKRIKNNKKIHDEIITLLKEAISKDEIRMGIEKWVGSEQWNNLKELYEGSKNQTEYGNEEFS
jgi:hypothetical protein